MSRIKKRAKLLPIFLIITTILVSLIIWSKNNFVKPNNIISNLPQRVPTPTPNPRIGTFSQISPDGSKTLINEVSASSSGELTSNLIVRENETNYQIKIYQEILNENSKITMPFNTWSPDNKYFFVIKENGNFRQYTVFAANDNGIKSEPFLDLSSDFLEKGFSYNLQDVTGWASPTLLVLRTKDEGSNKPGPSYWYEITTRRFYKLSSQF